MRDQLEMCRLTLMLLLDHEDIANKKAIEMVKASIKGIDLTLKLYKDEK